MIVIDCVMYPMTWSHSVALRVIKLLLLIHEVHGMMIERGLIWALRFLGWNKY